MTPISRRACLGLFAAAGMPYRAFAQGAYPSKPIRLVVPYPPGGGNDVLARSLKTHWEKAWSQAVVVENKPGGNGALGTEVVAKSPGDGYTLLMGSVATHVISPALKGKSTRYDPVKEFTPIAMVGSTPLILTVHPSVKANNLKEFIALAKTKKDLISFASVGNGSAGHLAGALFEQMAGVEMLHVPYKGISQASTELIGGLVNAAFSNVLNVLPLIRSGKLRALGVTGAQPLAILPEVAPIAQTLPGYSAELWWAVFGPAGLPADVVKRVRDETNAYLTLPEMKTKWTEEGITLAPMTGPEFSALIARDTKRWTDLILARRITEDS
jgi:tripartite-type tricarboxylate transporter receptor subunit TctC